MANVQAANTNAAVARTTATAASNTPNPGVTDGDAAGRSFAEVLSSSIADNRAADKSPSAHDERERTEEPTSDASTTASAPAAAAATTSPQEPRKTGASDAVDDAAAATNVDQIPGLAALLTRAPVTEAAASGPQASASPVTTADPSSAQLIAPTSGQPSISTTKIEIAPSDIERGSKVASTVQARSSNPIAASTPDDHGNAQHALTPLSADNGRLRVAEQIANGAALNAERLSATEEGLTGLGGMLRAARGLPTREYETSALSTDSIGTPAQTLPMGTPITTSTPAAPASGVYHVPSPVGTPAWNDAVNQTVVLGLRDNLQAAEIRVQPQDLGPIQISLKLDGDNASLAFFAPHADTRAALEANLPRLRDSLEAAGFSLTGASVGGGSAGNGQSQPQDRRGGGEANLAPSMVETTRSASRAINRLVDTFA